MPPKKGGGGKKDVVGRALLRRHQGHGPRGTGDIEVKPEPEKKGLSSILEMNSLDDFLDTALMAQRDFAAIKERDLLIFDAKGGANTTMMPARKKKIQGTVFRQLKVPRRPAWHTGMTPAQLDRAEKDAFLEWRREIASLEEASADRAKVTPFEKNLEVWRQLWRVIERSHVIVQIVDARDPLFYYSEDLHAYAAELSPPRARLILVNKADFLTAEQRGMWARHFRSRGWDYAFFSARKEQERLTEMARLQRIRELGEDIGSEGQHDDEEEEGEDDSEKEDEEEEEEAGKQQQQQQQHQEGGTEAPAKGVERTQSAGEGEDASTQVLHREDLIARVRSLAQEAAPEGSQATVGMVGFPNVGKSSVINVLMGVTSLDHAKARVAVSSTPGKTKHFQTLPLDDATMLCDCPGLVFPSFVATTADMVCAGVLPINQLRDHMTPVDLLCRRVPSTILRGYYGLSIKKASSSEEGGGGGGEEVQTAREFLNDLCEARGYTAQGSGVPDVNRAARMVLKEYVEGRLVFSHPPPGLSEEEEEIFAKQTRENMSRLSERLERRLRDIEIEEGDEGEEDGDGEDERRSEISTGTERSGKMRVRPTKKWGKKGKKLRDKTPYDDEDIIEGGPNAGAKIMGRKINTGPTGLFTRVTYPHSATAGGRGGARAAGGSR